jgi:hypothetical protein
VGAATLLQCARLGSRVMSIFARKRVNAAFPVHSDRRNPLGAYYRSDNASRAIINI